MTKNIDIPDGWKVKKLGEVAEIYRGASPRPIAKYLTDSSLGIPWIKIGDINPNDKYITTTKEKITQDGAKHSKIIHSGYFILSNSMSIGRPYISKITGCIHDGWLSINNYERNINIDYLYYALNSQYIKKSFANNASLGTVTNLNSDIVKNTHILLPPLAEQEKIAEILSLWDKAIEQTKELIAYKEKQKKGLMQNLLTGKKRLHGFNDKWKTVKLGEVIDKDIIYKKGQSLTAENANKGTIPVVAAGREIPYFHNNYNFKNIITISASGAYAGYIWYHNYPIWASDCNILYGQKDIFDTIFLFYILKLQQNKLYSLQTGGAQPHIYKNDICQLIIPKISFNEQKAIADILCKADEEIELLNKQLDLYMEQKKGLMQNLLTGKVRVTV